VRSNWRARYETARRERATFAWIAPHEASHALVDFVYDIEIERIAVGRGVRYGDDRLDGGCFWRTRDGQGIDLDVLVRASLAGPIADELFSGRDWDFTSNDYSEARDAARKIAEASGRGVDDVMEEARRKVTALLKKYEGVVKRLANELLQARWTELSGEQVERILRKAGVKRAGVSPGRSPLPGQERYYERRGGVDRATVNRDSDRRVAVFERRCDGYIA
jgi:hypothetical protein